MQPVWKTINIEFPKQRKIVLPWDSAILFLTVGFQKLKSGSQTDFCTLMFFAALFTIAKIWKQPKCPSTDKQNVVYTFSGILFSLIKGDNSVICDNMDELGVQYDKRNELVTERQTLSDSTYMKLLK